MSDPPKLVTKTQQESSEAIELLNQAIEHAKEAKPHAVLIVMVSRTPTRGERVRVKYIGHANTLLAMAARATHEINDAIDADNE